MLGEFAYIAARCMLVKSLLTNMLCGSGKIEILSSCTKLVCCLARSLNARSLRQQLPFFSFYSFTILVDMKGAMLTAWWNQMVVTVKMWIYFTGSINTIEAFGLTGMYFYWKKNADFLACMYAFYAVDGMCHVLWNSVFTLPVSNLQYGYCRCMQ